ncbi:GNAT family N-acetyltransferase [Roseicella aquatilis]|uniref:GNAT family N-acetyltransferase n=1 Tax=Roseicella aquatilis TaxID=2527868 RepID=A0A4R4D4V3_9PROT|nr:GNAT family N-acetyltransferase [Roseicella aquatilis]TCZ55106.1 GNAT family N-acetyltransferase [Roseicella aquatilis]
MTPTWRPMVAADLAPVLALADRLHPHHPESPAVFAERLALAPEGCRVLAGAGGPLGYAVSHPWTLEGPPALDTLLGALPARPTALHIHDIALDPAARGAGHAGAVLRALLATARLPCATLVAIPGTGDYWTRRGFREAPVAVPAALASYGAGARFMLRDPAAAARQAGRGATGRR